MCKLKTTGARLPRRLPNHDEQTAAQVFGPTHHRTQLTRFFFSKHSLKPLGLELLLLPFRVCRSWRIGICTSVSLRASTRVSSGFTLCRHSSPSFGSQQICSYSNLSKKYPDRSMVRSAFVTRTSHLSRPNLPLLSLRIKVFRTLILAYMLDSLVRVSRRVS